MVGDGESAVEAGVHPDRVEVTVHLVDEGVDTGPVVAQAAVPVLDGDDEAALQRRIQEVERPLYVDAVGRLARGGWTVEGRTVRWT